MNRREWLAKNPPPKVASLLRELLEKLTQEEEARKHLESAKQTYTNNVAYWRQQQTIARQNGNTNELTRANSEMGNAQAKIDELDKQLAASALVSTRISEIKTDLARAAKCPRHGADLQRHRNRLEDLFVCPNGPHYLLWTKVGMSAAFADIDITKPMPELDAKMEWV